MRQKKRFSDLSNPVTNGTEKLVKISLIQIPMGQKRNVLISELYSFRNACKSGKHTVREVCAILGVGPVLRGIRAVKIRVCIY